MASSGDPDTPQRLDHPYPLGCLSLITPLADNKRGQERKHTVKTTPPVLGGRNRKNRTECVCVCVCQFLASVHLCCSHQTMGGEVFLGSLLAFEK